MTGTPPAEKPDPAAGAAKRRTLGFIVLAELLAMSLWFSASAVVPELAAEWGVSGGRLSPAFDTFRVNSRPESSLAPNVVDTGEFEADHAWILGLETLLVHPVEIPQCERDTLDSPLIVFLGHECLVGLFGAPADEVTQADFVVAAGAARTQ